MKASLWRCFFIDYSKNKTYTNKIFKIICENLRDLWEKQLQKHQRFLFKCSNARIINSSFLAKLNLI